MTDERMSTQVPVLSTARAAYLHDAIDLDTFERLAGAALARQPTEIPDAIARLLPEPYPQTIFFSEKRGTTPA